MSEPPPGFRVLRGRLERLDGNRLLPRVSASDMLYRLRIGDEWVFLRQSDFVQLLGGPIATLQEGLGTGRGGIDVVAGVTTTTGRTWLRWLRADGVDLAPMAMWAMSRSSAGLLLCALACFAAFAAGAAWLSSTGALDGPVGAWILLPILLGAVLGCGGIGLLLVFLFSLPVVCVRERWDAERGYRASRGAVR
ncbi:hypothetical protein LDO26_08940 [Luteimonas sp. BDR2-5]|uniref:hypothetical protein n=1 Tax=Proluteimonas luteida TaxID=2878685 RepID=UPI001E638845|nr:hypothetical protein [Luteimonas sp. BDR2-5]MCD9028333.1 hypothetical protein [Luteimonas sp. BDR2-5]